MSLRLPIEVRRYRRLNNPKHQSGVNLVCPTTKKDKVILLCLFVSTVVTITSLLKLIMLLTQAVVLEKIVELAHYCVCPFPAITSFVAQKVDLSGNGLTLNSKHSILPRSQEVDRTPVIPYHQLHFIAHCKTLGLIQMTSFALNKSGSLPSEKSFQDLRVRNYQDLTKYLV